LNQSLGQASNCALLGVYNLSGLVAHELSDLESGIDFVAMKTFLINIVVRYSY
jgi:hypothetical protein